MYNIYIYYVYIYISPYIYVCMYVYIYRVSPYVEGVKPRAAINEGG